MRIKLSEIKEGFILAADVFGRTNTPIIPKKTVITNLHISVLEAFDIKEIEVEKMPVNGEEPRNKIDPVDTGTVVMQMEFAGLFLKSVTIYRREFKNWQSGLPVDISKIRALILPLLEKMENYQHDVFNLHRYSTKDSYVYQHPIAVGLLSGFIGLKMHLDKGEWLQLAIAGCLADCGMSKINPAILMKKDPLTIQEQLEIKKHPVYSYKMVRNIPLLRKNVKLSILEHHERLDGSGYPLGVRENRIPQYAKIIAIADIYHAMASERQYRNKQSPYKVLEMILEDNFGKFDISILKAFIRAMVDFSIGDRVKLSNGKAAEILFVDDKSPTRPLIKLIDNGAIIQLTQNRSIYIEDVLI